MTTDNFTEAARAEAERVRDENSPLEYGTIRATFLDAFLAGAEWARTHLAAQEPTDAECVAVQKCLYERTLTWVPTAEVRAALSAARAARRDEEKQ